MTLITLLLRSMYLVVLCTLLVSFVDAASVQYALQSQVPQIALVGQSYEWSFSPSTFRPDQSVHDSSSLSYGATSLPGWAIFDPATRTFSGTPAQTDLGSTTVQVVVSEVDDSDSVDSFQLIVSGGSAPTEPNPFSVQFIPDNPHISSADIIPEMSGGPGVRVREAWSFSIGLQWDTFMSSNGKPIYYSATLLNRDPLPHWMTFNKDQMTFDGVTPKINSESDITSFDVVLYGSEREGYSSIQDSFTFVIDDLQSTSDIQSTHALVLVSPLLPVNATADNAFSFDFDLFDFSGLELDGETVDRHNISDILVDTSGYPWLSYDNSTSRLSGTPPTDLLHEPAPILPLQVLAKYDNLSATTNITLRILPSVFATAILPPTFAPPSTRLSFALDQYFANGTGVDPSQMGVTMSLDPREASQWASFSPSSHTLSGMVPTSIAYTTLTATFHAVVPSTNATSTTSLVVNVASIPQNRTADGRAIGLSRHNRVIVGATLGTISGIVLLCLLFACCRWWYARQDDGDDVDPYLIDHGLHGDRLAAGVAEAMGGVRTQSPDEMYEEKARADGTGDQDQYDSVYLGAVQEHAPAPRPPSTYSASSSTAHNTDAKMAKGAFFNKLKVLSERSINSLRPGSSRSVIGPRQHRNKGKENGMVSSSPSDRMSNSSRVAMMFGFLGGRDSSTSVNSRPLIGRPMPMPPGSAGAALKMGMRTGTTPPPMSPSLSATSLAYPTLMLPSASTGSIRDDICKPTTARRVSVSRSMNDVSRAAALSRNGAGNRGLPTHGTSSQNSGLASTSESGETIEGGVDRTSWAEEPSYVWASGKVRTSPSKLDRQTASGASSPGGGVVPVRSSLDSVIPKRRKDFGPPPRLITPASADGTNGQGLPSMTEMESSASLAVSLNHIEIPSNRMSAVSFRSIDADTSHEDPRDREEVASIHAVTNRQVILGVATPKQSVPSFRGSNDSMKFGGAPSYDSAQSREEPAMEPQSSVATTRPRLVAFNSEHKPAQSTVAPVQRSVSGTAVVTDAPKNAVARPPKLVINAYNRASVANSMDVDDRLGLGIDYVRAFGMDGDGAGQSKDYANAALPITAPPPVIIQAHAAMIQSSTSGESWSSYDTAGRRALKGKRPSYGYHHKNGDISGAPSSKDDSPSLTSMVSSMTSPESMYTSSIQHPGTPYTRTHKHTLAPISSEHNSSSSLRRSTHRILVGAGQPFNFSVPLSAPLEGGGGDVEARMDDGKEELPDWLRFDGKEMEFWGVPPHIDEAEDEAGGSRMVGISVWQQEKCVAVFMVEVMNQ